MKKLTRQLYQQQIRIDERPHAVLCMKGLISFVTILILWGCNSSKDYTSEFENKKFDLSVINNWYLYDTLRQIILMNYDSFNLSEANRDFTYLYSFDSASKISGHNNKDVPAIMYPQTVELFESIGEKNIFGFNISKDSTISFLIRNTYLPEYNLDVRERLYWYPDLKKIIISEFPLKDTVIANKWQYQIWFDKRAEFF